MNIKASNAPDYNTKFGITLKKRDAVIVPKAPSNLLADGASLALGDLGLQTLMLDLKNKFDFNLGDADMLYVNMPDSAPVQIPISSAIVASVAVARPMRTDGVCNIVPANSPEYPDENAASGMGYSDYMQDFLPKNWVQDHVGKGAYSSADLKQYTDWSDSLEITVTQPPRHGKMLVVPTVDSKPSYVPNKNYIGKDRVEVEIRGKDFDGRAITKKVIYFINVVPSEKMNGIIAKYTSALQKYCGTDKPEWRISEVDRPVIGLDIASAASWLSAAQLSSLIVSAGSVFTGYSDLSGSAIGTTVGEGPQAAIILHTAAAGHGWYVDATPLDNTDDYLPTSNPNVWQAKAGSDAAGKMDMLSVLLHEYGHALGLDHSTDSGDFMATTLQAGERRLPSADELTLMSQLVAPRI